MAKKQGNRVTKAVITSERIAEYDRAAAEEQERQEKSRKETAEKLMAFSEMEAEAGGLQSPGYHQGKRILWVKLDSKGITDPNGDCQGPKMLLDTFTAETHNLVIWSHCNLVSIGAKQARCGSKHEVMVPMRRVMEIMLADDEGGE